MHYSLAQVAKTMRFDQRTGDLILPWWILPMRPTVTAQTPRPTHLLPHGEVVEVMLD
jgi:hypothetical protein